MPNQKLTDRLLATGVTLNDLIHIVITGDITDSPQGSSYKATIEQVATAITQTFTDIYVTGLTFNNSNYDLTVTRNDGVSLTDSLAILASDLTVTGGTYDPNTGNATFTNNTGGTFTVTGFLTGFTDVYVTGGTYSAGTATFTNTTGGTFTVTGFTEPFSGGSGNCITDFYVTNVYGCSPITIHDNIQSIGSSATGLTSFAFGLNVNAFGNYSTASGYDNIASGGGSHAEGSQTTASNYGAHSEGKQTTASGYYTHSEGRQTTASGDYSHTEGINTTSSGIYSHAEGGNTKSIGGASHSEGYLTTSFGNNSHSEGNNTTSVSNYSHSEGDGTVTSGQSSHAEGQFTITVGDYSHAEGRTTVSLGDYSHSEGRLTTSIGGSSHSEGWLTTSFGFTSHAEGQSTIASGQSSHAEGYLTTSSGYYSHAEGSYTFAQGNGSHAEGYLTTSSGDYSHSEGANSTSVGGGSHAEGNLTTSVGQYSHAEGKETTASGQYSHAEGNNTTASGYYSHAEGDSTISSGDYSHAEGIGTVTNGQYQHAQGMWNVTGDTTQGAFILGNGTDNLNRSNLIFAAGNEVNVSGKTITTNFQMTSGATNGYVLTSDASGNASWQVPAVSADTNFANTDLTFTGNRSHDTNGNYLQITTDNGAYNEGWIYLDKTGVNAGAWIGYDSNYMRAYNTGNEIFSSDGIITNRVEVFTGGTTFNTSTVPGVYFNVQTNTDQNSLYVNGTSGYVGMGMNTPTAKLHVNNTTTGNTVLFEDSTNPDSTPFVIDNSGKVGIGTTSPQYAIQILGTNSTFYYDPTSAGGRFNLSGNTRVPRFDLSIAAYLTKPATGGSFAMRSWDDTLSPGYGKQGDMAVYAGNDNNGLNLINTPGSSSEDYIRMYAGQDATGTSDVHIQGTGTTRGFVGFGTESPTSKIDVTSANGYQQFRIRQSYTPSSSGDTNGDIGNIVWDNTYLYVKTNTGWGRITLDYGF